MLKMVVGNIFYAVDELRIFMRWQQPQPYIQNGWKLVNLKSGLTVMENRIINIDPEILGGTPVFYGTRVPVKNLFNYLETGESIDYFLDDFSGVQWEQVIKLLEMSQKLIETSSNLLHENIA